MLTRFNGATAFQLWKLVVLIVCVELFHVLQWGHSFAAVEMVMVLVDCTFICRGFNGATAFQLWKFWFNGYHILHSRASMGPQLFSCGNLAIS